MLKNWNFFRCLQIRIQLVEFLILLLPRLFILIRLNAGTCWISILDLWIWINYSQPHQPWSALETRSEETGRVGDDWRIFQLGEYGGHESSNKWHEPRRSAQKMAWTKKIRLGSEMNLPKMGLFTNPKGGGILIRKPGNEEGRWMDWQLDALVAGSMSPTAK